MWETIKNDPVLKSITILVLGVLSFGLAFNIMFGRNSGGMEGGMDMGGGYSLVNTLAYILAISIKVLFIGLVIAAFILLIKLVKRYLIEGIEFKMFKSIQVEEIKKDPVLKTGLIAVATVLVLGLIVIIFNSVFSSHNGYGSIGRNYYGMMANGYISPVGNTAVIFGKLLLYVSIIGLVVSLIAYAKQGNISGEMKKLILSKNPGDTTIKCELCNYATEKEYKFCPSCGNERIKECGCCEAELKNFWKCCPHCGTEINTLENELNFVTVENVAGNTQEDMSFRDMIEEKDIMSETVDNTELITAIQNNNMNQQSHQKNRKNRDRIKE